MPDLSVVHVDQALTDVSIAYRNQDFLADLLFPPAQVSKQSNKYFIYSKDRFRAREDTRRPGAAANEIEWNLSTDTYYCEGHALAQAIPDELRANADVALDMDVDATETLTESIYLQREILAASKALNTTTMTSYRKTAAAWDVYATSTPITDIEAAKESILKQTGKLGNSLLLSYPVYLKLRSHPAIVSRVQFALRALPEDISPAMLASGLGLDNVYIAKTIKNTAVEDTTPTITMDYVWGKNALVFHSPGATGRRIVTFGAQFRWLFGANSDGFLVKRYRVERRTADVIEVQLYHDLKIVCAAAGYLFDACIS